MTLAPASALIHLEHPSTIRDHGDARPERGATGHHIASAVAAASCWCSLIAVALTAAVTALTLVGHERAEPYVMVLLAASLPSACSPCSRGDRYPASCGRRPGDSWFKGAVDAADEGLVITDATGRVVYANSAYRALVEAAKSQRRAVDRTGIWQRCGRLRGDLPSLQRGSREGANCRRICTSRLRVAGRPARWIRLDVQPLAGRTRAALASRCGPSTT